jgi:proline iminopeptidase
MRGLHRWQKRPGGLAGVAGSALLGRCVPESVISSDPRRSEGYATVNGVSHFFRTVGQGEPFVVLHGGPGMWHDELFPYFDDLATDHQVIFYDQRGNGRSLMSEITMDNFTVDWLVSDLDELRRAWGFDRIGIVGHSWGGLLSMYYASRHPDRVERLILVDAAPINTDLLIQSYRVLIGRFPDGDWERLEAMYESEAYLEGDPECLNAAMRLSEGPTFHVPAAREQYFDLVSFDSVTARNMVAISKPAQVIKQRVTVGDDLHRIECPTLIVHGTEDFIVPEAPELAQRLISGARLVYIPQSGHYPFIEQPEAFTQALRSFIDTTPTR